MTQDLLLAVTVDVEEEGLFRGRHDPRPQSLQNPTHLRRLQFLTQEFGLPLTLLAAYPVIHHEPSREILLSWRKNQGAELGVHLHPWSTPPRKDGESWRAGLLPAEALRAKLRRQIEAHKRLLGSPPRSFRMGRFDLPQSLIKELPAQGLTVDSSFSLHRLRAGGEKQTPESYDPYFLSAASPGAGSLLEAPLSVFPLVSGSGGLARRLAGRLPDRPGRALLAGFGRLGMAGVQPTMFSGPVMRMAAWIHLRRGGRVLIMYLHSSQLMPGGDPAYPRRRDVLRLVERIRGFVRWLSASRRVKGVTLSQLPAELAGSEGGGQ